MKLKSRAKWGWIVGVVAVMLLLASPGMSDQKKVESQGDMAKMQSMSLMMGECQKHHQKASSSIAQMMLMMEEGKRSNDPTKMRTALEKGETELATIKRDMAPCMNMMSMMQKMPDMMPGHDAWHG